MHNNDQLQQSFTVSQLNRRVKDLLEIHLPLIWVEGEISNFSRPASGHWYFTLKDESAQVSCAMFKRRNSAINFTPKVGDHLKLRAKVSLYEGRGDYQLIVEHMEQAGFGLLQKRFEEMKAKLQSEGLFDEAFKKPLPTQVKHLAVVTSATGAAIRDVLAVLERRFPALPVTVIPSQVQGEDAPEQLIKSIELADSNKAFDAILLTRGGGSIEDLWAFNSEALAKAIFACDTPIVSAIGHEVDFTIADFVADHRAATPSAAAEILSHDQENLLQRFNNSYEQLLRLTLNRITLAREKVGHISKRLKHPRDKLDQWHQRLDQLEIRMTQSIGSTLNTNSLHSQNLDQRLNRSSPLHAVKTYDQRLATLSQQMSRSIKQLLENKKQKQHRLIAELDIVSPISTIRRGYSIAKDHSGKIIRSIDEASVGDSVNIVLKDGELETEIKEIRAKQP